MTPKLINQTLLPGRLLTQLTPALLGLCLFFSQLAFAEQGQKLRIPLKKARIAVGILQGQITGPGGKAISASLQIEPRSQPGKNLAVPLDAGTGEFEIKLTPDVYRITATAPQYITSIIEVEVRDKYRAKVPLELQPIPLQAPDKPPAPAAKGKRLTIKYARDTEIGDELDDTKLNAIALEEAVHYGPDEILVPERGKALIDKLALLLSRDPGIARIEIAGHSHPAGDAALEQRNSLRRATYIKNYLIERGVDATRIRIEGKGSAEPLEGGADKGRAAGDRVEFTLYKLKE